MVTFNSSFFGGLCVYALKKFSGVFLVCLVNKILVICAYDWGLRKTRSSVFCGQALFVRISRVFRLSLLPRIRNEGASLSFAHYTPLFQKLFLNLGVETNEQINDAQSWSWPTSLTITSLTVMYKKHHLSFCKLVTYNLKPQFFTSILLIVSQCYVFSRWMGSFPCCVPQKWPKPFVCFCIDSFFCCCFFYRVFRLHSSFCTNIFLQKLSKAVSNFTTV